MRRESPNGVGRAREVNVDLDVPVVVLHLQQRFEGLNAGIGEQDVDAAELVARLEAAASRKAGRWRWSRMTLSQPAPAAWTSRPVSFNSVRAGRLDAGPRAHQGADVEAHKVGALTGKGDSRSAADPPGGAR